MKELQRTMKEPEHTNKGVICKECKKPVEAQWRFTEWDEDNNNYGTWDEIYESFLTAVKEKKEGRFVIYDISSCECGLYSANEGVLFNENCETYKYY